MPILVESRVHAGDARINIRERASERRRGAENEVATRSPANAGREINLPSDAAVNSL